MMGSKCAPVPRLRESAAVLCRFCTALGLKSGRGLPHSKTWRRQVANWVIVWSLLLGHWSLPLLAAELPKLEVMPIDDETKTKIEALSRLKGVDLESNPALKA